MTPPLDMTRLRSSLRNSGFTADDFAKARQLLGSLGNGGKPRRPQLADTLCKLLGVARTQPGSAYLTKEEMLALVASVVVLHTHEEDE